MVRSRERSVEVPHTAAAGMEEILSSPVDSGDPVRGDGERPRRGRPNTGGPMPQYLISVWHDEDYADNDWSDPEIQRMHQQVMAVNEDMERTGTWVFG